jgi:hypothetical protein
MYGVRAYASHRSAVACNASVFGKHLNALAKRRGWLMLNVGHKQRRRWRLRPKPGVIMPPTPERTVGESAAADSGDEAHFSDNNDDENTE